jgi:hypothetical protein
MNLFHTCRTDDGQQRRCRRPAVPPSITGRADDDPARSYLGERAGATGRVAYGEKPERPL